MLKPDALTSLSIAIEAALVGGRTILDVAAAGGDQPEAKRDGSPVTEADTSAEKAILAVLQRRGSLYPVIAEEMWDRNRAPAGNPPAGPWWAVDPLDGTKEFVKGLPEYTVNLALVSDGVPCVGVVYLPAADRLYAGLTGLGAWRIDHASLTPLPAAPGGVTPAIPEHWIPLPLGGPGPAAGGQNHAAGVPGGHSPAAGDIGGQTSATARAVIAISRSHGAADTEAFLRRLESAGLPVQESPLGSSAKFCTTAEGLTDCYPRFTSTKVWDCAAGAAVLLAAGGLVADHQGGKLLFDPVEILLPPLVCFRPGAPQQFRDTIYAHIT